MVTFIVLIMLAIGLIAMAWVYSVLCALCPKGQHRWRRVYGDEINLMGGARWACYKCPATSREDPRGPQA